MSTAVADSVDEIVAERLDVEWDALAEDTHFEDDLGAESLDLVEVAEAIEAETGVYVPDEALADLETVGDLRSYVADRAE